VYCRYCFRRCTPGRQPRRLSDFEALLATIAADDSPHEIIPERGESLMPPTRDSRRDRPVGSHPTSRGSAARPPIVLPERVTDWLLAILLNVGPTATFVVHANHPRELAEHADVAPIGACRNHGSTSGAAQESERHGRKRRRNSRALVNLG
jgi:L-lysine 2,3-aminomutase